MKQALLWIVFSICMSFVTSYVSRFEGMWYYVPTAFWSTMISIAAGIAGLALCIHVLVERYS
jgi:hypothetical protein